MTYQEAGEILLEESGVKIHSWRTEMSGRAWYWSGEISAPKPRTAKSFEVFAHEVGHIVTFRKQDNQHKYVRDIPSWKRELDACEYSMAQFERFGLKLPREVKNKIYWYVTYSVCQALNRGMKKIPQEVRKYTEGRIDKVPRNKLVTVESNSSGRRYEWDKSYRYYARMKRKY